MNNINESKNNLHDKNTESRMEHEQDVLMKEMIKKDMIKKIEAKFNEGDQDTYNALKALISDNSLKGDLW